MSGNLQDSIRRALQQGGGSDSSVATGQVLGERKEEREFVPIAQDIRWWQRLANKGDAQAQFNLGVIYYRGKGISQDYVEAVKWFREAAKQGEPRAQLNLGVAYIKGEGVPQNHGEAVEWFRKAAEQGIVSAQFNLGVAYIKGEGVSQNHEKAIKWFEKAAKQGEATAQFVLGMYYYEGRIVSQSYQEAVKWFKQSAEKEIIGAQLFLSFCYKKVKGVEKLDEQASLSWLQRAAANLIVENNELTYSFKEDDDEDQEFIQFLQIEAKQNIAPAQVILAHLHKTGNGVEQNNPQWLSELEQAAQQQDLIAQYQLATAYMEGDNVNYDFDKAYELFEKIQRQLDKDNIAKGFSLAHFTDEDIEKKTHADYPHNIKQWLGLLAEQKIRILNEQRAKKSLEDVMAMFAHKFRGPLYNIHYYNEKQQPEKIPLEIQTMESLLNVFSIISTKPERLREDLLTDKQGTETLLTVLKKAIIEAIVQSLPAHKKQRIDQHYFNYAQKKGLISKETTEEEWKKNYKIRTKIRDEWQAEFYDFVKESDFEHLLDWVQSHFFSINITGFDKDNIRFSAFNTKESILLIIMTEVFLNVLKYYSSGKQETVQLSWERQSNHYYFICQNPTHNTMQEQLKGSGRGSEFLKLIAQKLAGQFTTTFEHDTFKLKMTFPSYLFEAST